MSSYTHQLYICTWVLLLVIITKTEDESVLYPRAAVCVYYILHVLSRCKRKERTKRFYRRAHYVEIIQPTVPTGFYHGHTMTDCCVKSVSSFRTSLLHIIIVRGGVPHRMFRWFDRWVFSVFIDFHQNKPCILTNIKNNIYKNRTLGWIKGEEGYNLGSQNERDHKMFYNRWLIII